jgi:hypothetical protein
MDEDAPFAWLARRLASARADAARIARELVARGHLAPEQAADLEGAVEAAIRRGRELLAEALREPRRVAESLRGEVASHLHRGGDAAAALAERVEEIAARTADVEERLARLERAVDPDGLAGSSRES